MATEVLGWGETPEGVLLMPVGNEYCLGVEGPPKYKAYYMSTGQIDGFILSPEGREAIAKEINRRKWDYITSSQAAGDDDFFTSIRKAGSGRAVSYHQCGCEYHSIAIAALKAVRGEG